MTDTELHARRAASFHDAAEAYESARPGYPAEATAWMIPDGAASVLDLGAGTGKLTESLLAPGREVYAVDPSSEMLRVLAEKLPAVTVRVGRGERVPLPDASVDAVTVAQAWHWMDREQATAEVARVLKPGGTFALIWNQDDDRVDWVRELGGDPDAAPRVSSAEDEELEALAGFAPGEVAGWPWTRRMTRDELIAYESSVSAFLVASPAEQAARLAYLHTVLDRHPEVERGGLIEFPVYAVSFRYRKDS